MSYRRNPHYWGTDVPSRKGMFNFDRVVYRLYKDGMARLEAFKAGEFDVMSNISRRAGLVVMSGRNSAAARSSNASSRIRMLPVCRAS